jgi:tetratricopeptide (TPR) repeat protein
LANVVASEGDIKNAIAHYESAVRIRPEFVEAQYMLAVALTQTGHPDQAIEHYQAALRLEPKNLQVYASLAQTLALVHRSDEAIAISEKGIEVARSSGKQEELKQFDEWLKHYQTELRRAPEAASPPSLPSQK